MSHRTQTPEPHVGQLLARVIRRRRIRPSVLARRAGIKPMRLHLQLLRPSAETALLARLSNVLELDLFQLLSQD